MYHLFSVLENKRRVNKNQKVNNHFGGSLNLTLHQSYLTWVESQLVLYWENKAYMY